VAGDRGIDGVRAGVTGLVEEHDHGPSSVADHRQQRSVIVF
jgi:hypothetical protein